ncbi:PREDICTED: uncharacterized protein LOC105449505 [Wasmannia auropunctata]|uniref:uncharacterized protein LOC105449505 n=1 Tax=Wasmannia auropunctata TaxID=64793 RepID=UPI0005EF2FB6|nr:PREDICTED: uncharacterized protein LOC105449505 [Wasmannia auropunctata]
MFDDFLDNSRNVDKEEPDKDVQHEHVSEVRVKETVNELNLPTKDLSSFAKMKRNSVEGSVEDDNVDAAMKFASFVTLRHRPSIHHQRKIIPAINLFRNVDKEEPDKDVQHEHVPEVRVKETVNELNLPTKDLNSFAKMITKTAAKPAVQSTVNILPVENIIYEAEEVPLLPKAILDATTSERGTSREVLQTSYNIKEKLTKVPHTNIGIIELLSSAKLASETHNLSVSREVLQTSYNIKEKLTKVSHIPTLESLNYCQVRNQLWKLLEERSKRDRREEVTQAISFRLDRDVYVWGHNIEKQLNPYRNIGDHYLSSPIQINKKPGVNRVSDIATVDSASAIKSSINGFIYIWGSLCGQSINKPICEYINIFNICDSMMGQSPVSMAYIDDEKYILNNLEAAFNDHVDTCDLEPEMKDLNPEEGKKYCVQTQTDSPDPNLKRTKICYCSSGWLKTASKTFQETYKQEVERKERRKEKKIKQETDKKAEEEDTLI